ncbi:riboflavin kinase [Cercophora scortea]|uniref:Riboflavin kinase n=1 Tax=Cercophora scortea TaxID=314031 RepID=A0AAE0MJH5_9PEZI|nr:riboflavin kinase [Cercophora scortea]
MTTTTPAPGSSPAPTTSSKRPLVIGPPEGPEPPYPLRMEGKVIKGFGRGSKELGIPTANLPVPTHTPSWITDIPSGVYFGWASLLLPPSHPDYIPHSPTNSPSSPSEAFKIHPMVMSIGYNPFYKNTLRSAEVHILHPFSSDFYGCEMRLLIAGFIRQEKDYAGLDALIEDINTDCEVARQSLGRGKWMPRRGLYKDQGEAGEMDCEWLLRPLSPTPEGKEGEGVENGDGGEKKGEA